MPPSELADSARISPTAHYTGYVWYAHGLSHEALATRRGRLLYHALWPAGPLVSRLAGGLSLEAILLRRHRAIDGLLERAIASGEVGQVVEIAAGLSPRGWRFACQHPELLYLEADLPGMARTKRDLLAEMGSLGAGHRVVELDALADDGPRAIGGLTAELDPTRGTALITEGLLNYFPADPVRRMWRRWAAFLGQFPSGLYLSDLHVADENDRWLVARAFRRALGVFARGAIHFHFARAADAEDALRASGFASAVLHPSARLAAAQGARDGTPDVVRIVEARALR